MSLSDIDLLLWGLLRSRNNRGISLPKYMLPTLVQLPLIICLHRAHLATDASVAEKMRDSNPANITDVSLHAQRI